MPIFRQSLVLEMARNVKAFLRLEAGVTRGRVPGLEDERAPAPPDGGALREQLESKDEEIARLKAQIVAGGDAPAAGLRPENVIWVFGVARTGSSWLTSMMADMRWQARWNEPYVGDVFGFAYYNRAPAWQRERKQFILGDPFKEAWLRSLRTFFMEGATVRFPKLTQKSYLVVKEPNGSIGAPLLSGALPESRMIFLVRDPRDVVTSLLAAQREGSWGSKDFKTGEGSLADENPDEFVRQRANMYMASLTKAKEAYEAHEGPKVRVDYDDLRYNTFEVLKGAYSRLEIPVDEDELRGVVDKHAWENIPEKDKGADKPRRKATPGSWREELTPGQVRIVEEITAPVLEEYYSQASPGRA